MLGADWHGAVWREHKRPYTAAGGLAGILLKGIGASDPAVLSHGDHLWRPKRKQTWLQTKQRRRWQSLQPSALVRASRHAGCSSLPYAMLLRHTREWPPGTCWCWVMGPSGG